MQPNWEPRNYYDFSYKTNITIDEAFDLHNYMNLLFNNFEFVLFRFALKIIRAHILLVIALISLIGWAFRNEPFLFPKEIPSLNI